MAPESQSGLAQSLDCRTSRPFLISEAEPCCRGAHLYPYHSAGTLAVLKKGKSVS